MKVQSLLLILVFVIGAAISGTAQVDLGKVFKRSKDRADRQIERRIENKIDKAVDKTLDDAEDGVKKDKKNKKDKSKSDKSQNNKENADNEIENANAENNDSPKEESKQDSKQKEEKVVVWNKFDFVPGDQVIFEDAPSNSERNGEFPSRWDLHSGVAEIVNYNGENVICFMAYNTHIMPYLKNADKPYLPDVFTVEMDLYFAPEHSHHRYYIYLFDRKHHKSTGYFAINVNGITIGDFSATLPGSTSRHKDEGGWRRVSIAYTNGQLKAYLNDTRLINIPRYEYKPTGITIQAEMSSSAATGESKYLKNFRIAEGGVPYYDRAMQDGKIIVTGIRFDVGKATLKPESMGPLNEILYVMQKNPEIKFSVEGHTDSDGDEATNQKLSEARAKAVMDKLIEMGIDRSRLTSKGFGESKPMVENTSAEGKAQNRRVEFVKF
jgi:OmpA-OmpF porin, OOP family